MIQKSQFTSFGEITKNNIFALKRLKIRASKYISSFFKHIKSPQYLIYQIQYLYCMFSSQKDFLTPIK